MKHITSASLLAAVFTAAQLFGASAHAEEKTRAEVKAEAASANKAGTIAKGDASAAPAGKSTKTRAEVKAERDAASKTIDRATGDASVTPLPKSTKTRAEVKKERDASKPTDAAKEREYTPAK